MWVMQRNNCISIHVDSIVATNENWNDLNMAKWKVCYTHIHIEREKFIRDNVDTSLLIRLKSQTQIITKPKFMFFYALSFFHLSVFLYWFSHSLLFTAYISFCLAIFLSPYKTAVPIIRFIRFNAQLNEENWRNCDGWKQ